MWPFTLPIEWNAVATLLAGALAVGGAVLVAKRQLELRRNEVRVQLYDRRRDVIRRFDVVSGVFYRPSKASNDDYVELREVVRDVELLFDEETYQRAKRIFDGTVLQPMFNEHAKMYREDGDEENRISAVKNSHEQYREIANGMPALRKLLVDSTRLGTIFK